MPTGMPPGPLAAEGQRRDLAPVPDSDGDQGKAEDQGKVDQLASLVFAKIENRLEHHLHTQMEMPSAEQAKRLREDAPEVYKAWIDIARQKADTEAYIQRAQYEVPERLARTGRPWGLVALVCVLGFCAYLASLGGAAVYLAGVVAALDLVAMMGLFFGFRPELEARRRQQLPGEPEAEAKPEPES